MTKKAKLHKGKDKKGQKGVYLSITEGDFKHVDLIFIAENVGTTKKEKMNVLKKFKNEIEKQEEKFELELSDRLQKIKEMV